MQEQTLIMLKLKVKHFSILLVAAAFSPMCSALTNGFVYLSNIDPSIMQDIRYASPHNFVGRRLVGYKKPTCILTKEAALALKKIQEGLQKQHYSLKVYDCYRPKMAVNEMHVWSKSRDCVQMKNEFFPREKKSALFKKGYIALYSGHSRGSTVDLTIVNLNDDRAAQPYQTGQHLRSCYGKNRLRDNSIDMGTNFDCLDKTAHVRSAEISRSAYHNRLFLRQVMVKNGFKPYNKEWWHFTLQGEPYRQYFNFPVE